MKVNVQNVGTNKYESMDIKDLQILASQEIAKGNYAEAEKVFNALKEKNKEPVDESQEFDKTYKEKQDEIAKLDEEIQQAKDQTEKDKLIQQKNELFKSFFTEDIKQRKSKIEKSTQERERSKQKQIDDLQSQLNDTFTTMPSLGEYLSLERRRLVTIHNTLQKYKEDKQNYPKNFLIYAMALSDKSVFGVRQGLKRNWIKLARKWKADTIGKNLETFEKKLDITKDDKKPRKKGIKLILQKELHEAKKVYIEKQKINIGLAA